MAPGWHHWSVALWGGDGPLLPGALGLAGTRKVLRAP